MNSSRDIKDLHPVLSEAYTKACAEYKKRYASDPQPFLTCTFRSNEDQQKHYDQPHNGKDDNGNGIIDDASEKVTQARPGESPHNYLPSFAFDVAFVNTATQKLDWNAKYFKQFADCIAAVSSVVDSGINWKFKDAPHHELKGWKKLNK